MSLEVFDDVLSLIFVNGKDEVLGEVDDRGESFGGNVGEE